MLFATQNAQSMQDLYQRKTAHPPVKCRTARSCETKILAPHLRLKARNSPRKVQEARMQTTGATVTSWGEAVMTSMVAALAVFLAAIPRVIGFLLILIIGWVIAGLIASAVAALLRTVKFNDLAQRS